MILKGHEMVQDHSKSLNHKIVVLSKKKGPCWGGKRFFYICVYIYVHIFVVEKSLPCEGQHTNMKKWPATKAGLQVSWAGGCACVFFPFLKKIGPCGEPVISFLHKKPLHRPVARIHTTHRRTSMIVRGTNHQCKHAYHLSHIQPRLFMSIQHASQPICLVLSDL